MEKQENISRWLGYTLLTILIGILCYQLWYKWNTNVESFVNKNNKNQEDTIPDKNEDTIPDYFEKMFKEQVELALQQKKVDETPKVKFIYSGYNEIYDYVISKSIYETLHKLEINNMKKKKSLFAFENIPKLYVYVLKNQPTKIHIVFTNMKKSRNLIDLFNNNLKQENVEPQKNKIVEKGNTKQRINSDLDMNLDMKGVGAGIAFEKDVKTIKDLIIKHNLTKVVYDFEDNQKEIMELIRLSANLDDNILNNFVFYPQDNSILKSEHNINEKETILQTLKYDTKYLKKYIEQMTVENNNKSNRNKSKNNTFKHTFTNTLLGDSNFIFDEQKKDYLFTQEELTKKERITNYLFRNNNLGIFISLDRIDELLINEINSNLSEIYFRISSKTGELSSKEIMNKLAILLNIEITREFIRIQEELDTTNTTNTTNTTDNVENKKQKLNNIKPNISFYYLLNEFQIAKVVIRPYERDLIM